MRSVISSWMAAALVVSVNAHPAHAATLTYQATGIVTTFQRQPTPGLSVFPNLAIGDEFVMRWTFDDEVGPCLDVVVLRRYCSISVVELVADGVVKSFAPSRADLGYQTVGNSDVGSSSWGWFASAGFPEASSFNRLTGSMSYSGPPADNPLSASGLQIPRPEQLPFSGTDFSATAFTYEHANLTTFQSITTDLFGGTIVSVTVVPLPGTVVLFTSALTLIAGLGRRNRTVAWRHALRDTDHLPQSPASGARPSPAAAP